MYFNGFNLEACISNQFSSNEGLKPGYADYPICLVQVLSVSCLQPVNQKYTICEMIVYRRNNCLKMLYYSFPFVLQQILWCYVSSFALPGRHGKATCPLSLHSSPFLPITL